VSQTDTPEISVLIVTYNNSSTIDNCLEALFKQTYSSFELLVWDNASSDNTLEKLRTYPNLRLIASPKNVGFAVSMNSLSEKTSGKFLFILNPDCICPPDTLQKLLVFAELHPGAISAAFMFPDGQIHASARDLPTYSNILFSRRSPLSFFGLFGSSNAGYFIPDRAAKVPAVSATGLFLRKALFNESGRFDERFFLYCEDLDLCRRLHAKNIDIWYLPELKITHLLRVSSRKNPLKPLYHHHWGIYKYFTKHYPRQYIKNSILFVMLMFGFILSALFAAFGSKKQDD
jgi:GT2 family glycosyltransferase